MRQPFYQLWLRTGKPLKALARSIRYGLLGRIWLMKPASHEHLKEDIVLSQAPRTVAVVIPCHNYANLLPKAIDSVLAQTTQPDCILVVDDASDDHPEDVVKQYKNKGVTYCRVEHRSLARTRNAGAAATQSTFLLFLDPDDTLPPKYIERCLEAANDPRIGVVYGDQKHVGEASQYLRVPEFSKETLMRSNYISSNALIRRQAFDLVGGYRNIEHSLEDWDFYRRLVQTGYIGKKADTFFYYTIRKDSMVHTLNRSALKSYANDATLTKNAITIFTPFAGRRDVLERYTEGIRSLNFDLSQIRLHWYNTCNDDAFDTLLRETMATMPVGQTTYTRAPLPEMWNHDPDSLIRKRIKNTQDADYYYQLAVVRAYNHMIQTCGTEYVLSLEDDVRMEPETLTRLLNSVEWNTAAVIAPYKSGFFPRYEVWQPLSNGTVTHIKECGSGVQEVGGCGFGCTLFRTCDLRAIAPIYTGVRSEVMQWYDQISYLRLRDHGKILCNWDAEVEHMKTERFAEGLATTFT